MIRRLLLIVAVLIGVGVLVQRCFDTEPTPITVKSNHRISPHAYEINRHGTECCDTIFYYEFPDPASVSLMRTSNANKVHNIVDDEPKPEQPKREAWLPHWVGARYRLGENGQDGCYVIFVDKDTCECDCNDLRMGVGYCCRLADSLERNGPPPPKKKPPILTSQDRHG